MNTHDYLTPTIGVTFELGVELLQLFTGAFDERRWLLGGQVHAVARDVAQPDEVNTTRWISLFAP
jgi:hypothetical protein